jgi:diacylglycerol kinase (ATP)
MWGDCKARSTSRRKKKEKALSVNREVSSSSTVSVTDSDLTSAVQDIGDKLIEVVGLENCLHMGQVRTGLRSSGKRLAQCSSVIIKTKKKFPMQVDGEPWCQAPCRLEITHKNQVPMLVGPPPKSRSFFSFLSKEFRKNPEEQFDDDPE